MIRVMEGYAVFGPLQRKRIDWKQEMFQEEEKIEREREQAALKADECEVAEQGNAPL